MKPETMALLSAVLVVAGFLALVVGVWLLVSAGAALVSAGVFCTVLGVAIAKGWL